MADVKRGHYEVGIAIGDGLIVRVGDVTMFVADTAAAPTPLLGILQSAAQSANPGAVLAEHLAPLVFGGSAPPFGAVAPTADGLLLLLRGRVTAAVEHAEGVRQLSGERAVTWVDEILPETVHRVAVGRAEGPAVKSLPYTDLRAGVVPGGGFVLRPVAPQAPPPATSEPRPAAPPTTVVRAAAVEEPTTKVGGAPQGPPPPSHPSETSNLPSVNAVLMSDDGAVYPLDRPYVLGRDPLLDETVRTAQATPITLQGDAHISRVHAHVTIERGIVVVRDAATPGGTFVAAPGAAEWTEIDTAGAELAPGWSLRVGERVFTYRGDTGA